MSAFSFYIEDYERPVRPSELLITNRSFLYGEGAITCSLLRQGKVLFLSDHRRRLENSWRSFYPRCSQSLLRGKIVKNIHRIPRLEEDHYIKICLFANDSQRSFDCQRDDLLPNVILYGGKHRPHLGTIRLKTVVKTHVGEKKFQKTPYYLNELQDRARAKSQSYTDILYTTPRGEILEGSLYNIFFICGDKVFTPSISPFILAGIARKHFINVLRQKGVELVERVIHRRELDQVDGVLLSNSLSQISIVEQLDRRDLYCPFGKKLQELYRQSCEDYFKNYEEKN